MLDKLTVSHITGLRPACGSHNNIDSGGLSCRITPVVPVFTATSAINAPEKTAAGAPITASARTVSMGMGSAVAMKVSTAPHVRTVSQDATESTALQVRDPPLPTEFPHNSHAVCREVHVPRGAVRYHEQTS